MTPTDTATVTDTRKYSLTSYAGTDTDTDTGADTGTSTGLHRDLLEFSVAI